MKKKLAAKMWRFLRELAVLAGLALAFVPAANASDYGCKVLLCLANPNGPTAVAECVDPINQLWDDLAHFRPFPTCEMSGDSYAKPGYSYYDQCPNGTSALSDGTYAVQGGSPSPVQQVYAGIGEGDGVSGNWQSGGALPQKICVGNRLGQTITSIGSGEDSHTVPADVYDYVVAMDPQRSPRFIDVFVESTLFRRVRW